MQCGPGNDDAWNRAEQETELAKQEACNVKVQTKRTTETAELAAQKKREVTLISWHRLQSYTLLCHVCPLLTSLGSVGQRAG